MTHSRFSRVAVALIALVIVTVPTAVRAQALVTVRGIAFDSLHGTPLSGAFIGIAGTSRTAISDDRGRFVFDSVVPGTYRFVMQHDVLDSIGLSGAATWAVVSTDRGTVTISVPSFAALWQATCRTPKPAKDDGLIFGTVRAAGGQRPAAGVKVSATWLESTGGNPQPVSRGAEPPVGHSLNLNLVQENYDATKANINAALKLGTMSQMAADHAIRALNAETQNTVNEYTSTVNQDKWRTPVPLSPAGWRLAVTSDSTGYYSLCGVPTTTAVQLLAANGSAASEFIVLMQVENSPVVRRDLVLVQRPDSATISKKPPRQ